KVPAQEAEFELGADDQDAADDKVALKDSPEGPPSYRHLERRGDGGS
ncbi:hypothetical protein TIFTF001_055914, partial [Ficus carica]